MRVRVSQPERHRPGHACMSGALHADPSLCEVRARLHRGSPASMSAAGLLNAGVLLRSPSVAEAEAKPRQLDRRKGEQQLALRRVEGQRAVVGAPRVDQHLPPRSMRRTSSCLFSDHSRRFSDGKHEAREVRQVATGSSVTQPSSLLPRGAGALVSPGGKHMWMWRRRSGGFSSSQPARGVRPCRPTGSGAQLPAVARGRPRRWSEPQRWGSARSK